MTQDQIATSFHYWGLYRTARQKMGTTSERRPGRRWGLPKKSRRKSGTPPRKTTRKSEIQVVKRLCYQEGQQSCLLLNWIGSWHTAVGEQVPLLKRDEPDWWARNCPGKLRRGGKYLVLHSTHYCSSFPETPTHFTKPDNTFSPTLNFTYWKNVIKNAILGASETAAQGLRTLVAFAEDPGSVPRIHTVIHSLIYNSASKGSDAFSDQDLLGTRYTCGTPI